MSRYFDCALNQCDSLASDRLYRFAVSLLRNAAKGNGHLTATRALVCTLYKGEWNTARVALRELKDAGIIYLQNINEVCLITFCAWLPLNESVSEKRSEPVIENRSPDATATTSSETEPVIENRSPDATVGIGIGMVGRYLNTNTNTQYQELNTYLPNTVDHVRANGHHANGNGHAATLEAEPPTALEQTALPPSAEAPPSPDVATDDAARIVALLTDEEIGVTPANARRVSGMHTFAFVVKQVATWWENSDLGPGALFKNRLLNAKQFPPGAFSEAFQASECYARHYPLQGEDREQWRLWQAHKDHIDQVEGLEGLQVWVDALPAALKRTLGQLPIPKASES